MSLEHPYVKNTVQDGVDDVGATIWNHQEDQLEALTDIAFRQDDQIIVAVQPDDIAPSSAVDVLTNRAVDTPAKTIRIKIGASDFITPSSMNLAGPAGTGVTTLIQRFTADTLAKMGCLSASGQRTGVKIVIYENVKPVGWIDATVVAP